MRADREEKVIMPLFHTRQEIAGISGLLSAMQLLPDSLAALADIDLLRWNGCTWWAPVIRTPLR